MRAFTSFLIGLVFVGLAMAQEKPDGAPSEIPAPYSVTREMSLRLDGRQVNFIATAGESYLRSENGAPRAAIFSIAYVEDELDDPTERPVIFVFNGGPGSASLWLHMGAWGPKRVITPSDGTDVGAPPYRVEDNPHSLLDVADLVFIDPVGTGYSRALGSTDAKEFYGVNEDAESIAEFIRIWITRNGRWNSPKYLAGESYGATRAAAVAQELQGGWNGIALNGVVLVSAILDFQTARFAPGNDTAHIAFFPTMATTAWYHDKVDRARWGGDLEAFAEDARSFATHILPPALIRGATLSEAERGDLADQMSDYLGVSADWILDTNLRVDPTQFRKELLRDRDLTVGRFDSRYTGVDSNSVGDTPDNDPSGYGMDAAYTAAINDYLTRELGVNFREGGRAEGEPLDRLYKVLTGEPGSNWNWSQDSRGWPAYVNVAPWLGQAMRENDEFRVLLASGWYDLATPFFGAEMSLYKNRVVLDRVDFTYYEAGHMMYLVADEAENLSQDVRNFIRGE
ncbi:MAG: peptidase S10 [Hyphomonadaceae bacterium]|nr:peptidase S10 [Hyphomonadaceae bacterium]